MLKYFHVSSVARDTHDASHVLNSNHNPSKPPRDGSEGGVLELRNTFPAAHTPG